MYESYWQLSRPAFENDADAAFYFPARSHHGALLKLRYLIENRKGAGVLVGGHGTGKTYLTHVLEQELDERFRPFSRLVFPQLSPAELLSYLAIRLGATDAPLETGACSQDYVLRVLERQLETLTSRGKHAVIVIDEAHLLEPAHLTALQLLLNYPQTPRIDLTLILMGQPELLPRIQRAAGLDSRIAVRMAVHPLTQEETLEYVKHRLHAAGLDACMFDDSTVKSFWELSQGIPRRLNQLCDLSLLVGYADGLHRLTPIEIEAAAEELVCISAD